MSAEASGRGRPRKFRWFRLEDLNSDSSAEAQYLKLASVNNPFLARLESTGCPECGSRNLRLRHDAKFDNVRSYCAECKYETSYHIKKPTKDQLRVIQIYSDKGILIAETTADDYHEKTLRESTDLSVAKAEQKPDLGGEWFDGISGTSSQIRYVTREEALERIARRKMKKEMAIALDELENEKKGTNFSVTKAYVDRAEAENRADFL